MVEKLIINLLWCSLQAQQNEIELLKARLTYAEACNEAWMNEAADGWQPMQWQKLKIQ